MKYTVIFVLISAVFNLGFSQEQLYRKELFDVTHYSFHLTLDDDTDEIQGQATVTFNALKDQSSIELDLVQLKDDGTGMTVDKVTENNILLSHTQNDNKLKIQHSWKQDQKYSIIIDYHGIPSDGLIIGQSRHGHRTFFGDNWPNRAHHWLPTVDHPSDKAMVDFIVNAPVQYEVVATGRKIEETTVRPDRKITHYSCPNPMPTKVMVIGVAEFAEKYAGDAYGHPVTSWVYPEDRDNGFNEYQPGVEILKYFIDKIGPYPNLKLANVQSKTRYGGMENAGNIFYYEGSVNGVRDDDNLIAHEIAHQWFGNSASELDWHHVWLSEGFATYMTNAFIEDHEGIDTMQRYLKQQRAQVIKYYKLAPAPVINTKITNFIEVLSPNSYQKGGWFLHMLRNELGDDLFWKGIKQYYNTYKYSNALSEDLQRIMEQVSGRNLDQFFKQWLYMEGFPELKIGLDQGKKKLNITVQQLQDQGLFNFPLEISFVNGKGKQQTEKLRISQKESMFSFKTKGAASQIEIDPGVKLLFELVE